MKKKIILDTVQTENLLKMFLSDDKDNSYVAFKVIEECNIKESIGYILILSGFSRIGINVWKKESPKTWEAIVNLFNTVMMNDETSKIDKTLNGFNSTSILQIMIVEAVSIEIIVLFMKLHSREILENLKFWGYPVDTIDINIKLKEYVQ